MKEALKENTVGDSVVFEKEKISSNIERFKELAANIRFSGRDDEQFSDWDGFQRTWSEMYGSVEYCQGLLNARSAWLEIREYGDGFQHFFEDEIFREMDRNASGSYRLFEMLNAYYAIGFKDATKFANKVIDLPIVWNNQDGSMIHHLLGFLGKHSDSESVPAIVRYVSNTCKEDFVRGVHRDSDVSIALRALTDAVGWDRATLLMKPVVEQYQSFANLIEQNLICFKDRTVENRSDSSNNSDIDFVLERQRLETLEIELDQMRSRPRPSPSYDPMDNDDWWHDDHMGSSGSDARRESLVDEEPQIDSVSIERVNNVVLKEGVAPTATSVIQLHMFNFLSRNPHATDEEMQNEFEKINRLSDRENLFSDIKNPLPTIGVEIEIPHVYLTNERVAILDAFQINNYPEVFDDLWEVNPDFSYSAAVQARIIQEVVQLGAVPIDAKTGKIRSSTPLSLHVNFGMPQINGLNDVEIKYRKYDDEMKLLNDLIVYGFTSVERIWGRKTLGSIRISDEASKSKKDKNANGEVQEEFSGYSQVIRMELRVNEFKDYPTYRMLFESQRLVAMLTSQIKYQEGATLTFAEACLADLWVDFEKEINSYFKSESVTQNMVDNNPSKLVNMLQTTDLQKWSRFLISDYARKANRIIKEAVVLS